MHYLDCGGDSTGAYYTLVKSNQIAHITYCSIVLIYKRGALKDKEPPHCLSKSALDLATVFSGLVVLGGVKNLHC